MRRRGGITLFLAIVVPVILLSTLALADYFRFRQNLSKIYKITYAVSASELSCHNSYFKENFSMLACYDRSLTAELLSEYFDKNQVAADREISVAYDRLSDPNRFREAVLDASLNWIVHTTIDAVKEGLESEHADSEVLRAKEKVDDLQRSLSGCFEIPKSWFDWDPNDALEEILSQVKQRRDQLRTEFVQFGEWLREARAEAEKLQEELKDPSLHDLRVLEAQYRTHHAKVDAALDEVSNLGRDCDALKTELALLLEEFQIPGKTGAELNALRSAIEACRDRLNDKNAAFRIAFREAIGENQGGLLAEFLKQLDTLKQNLVSNLSLTQSEGGVLPLKKEWDYSKRAQPHLTLGSVLDKLRVNEWAVQVFRSYDVQCPRKAERDLERQIRGEVEYLISGHPEEAASFGEVKLKLTALRLLPNMAIGITDTTLMREITGATAAIPPPFQLIARGACFSAICFAESYIDVEKLLKGYGIPMLKSREDWVVRWSTLAKTVLTNVFDSPPEPTGLTDHKLYYLDYLRILLALQSEKQTILRAMNLIESDLRERSESKRGLDDFSVGHRIEVRWSNPGLFRVAPAELRFVNRLWEVE